MTDTYQIKETIESITDQTAKTLVQEAYDVSKGKVKDPKLRLNWDARLQLVSEAYQSLEGYLAQNNISQEDSALISTALQNIRESITNDKLLFRHFETKQSGEYARNGKSSDIRDKYTSFYNQTDSLTDIVAKAVEPLVLRAEESYAPQDSRQTQGNQTSIGKKLRAVIGIGLTALLAACTTHYLKSYNEVFDGQTRKAKPVPVAEFVEDGTNILSAISFAVEQKKVVTVTTEANMVYPAPPLVHETKKQFTITVTPEPETQSVDGVVSAQINHQTNAPSKTGYKQTSSVPPVTVGDKIKELQSKKNIPQPKPQTNLESRVDYTQEDFDNDQERLNALLGSNEENWFSREKLTWLGFGPIKHFGFDPIENVWKPYEGKYRTAQESLSFYSSKYEETLARDKERLFRNLSSALPEVSGYSSEQKDRLIRVMDIGSIATQNSGLILAKLIRNNWDSLVDDVKQGRVTSQQIASLGAIAYNYGLIPHETYFVMVNEKLHGLQNFGHYDHPDGIGWGRLMQMIPDFLKTPEEALLTEQPDLNDVMLEQTPLERVIQSTTLNYDSKTHEYFDADHPENRVSAKELALAEGRPVFEYKRFKGKLLARPIKQR
jgi:hypothetical protein